MSYTRKRYSRRAQSSLGDAASTIAGLINTVGIATDVASDPYLPETVCRVAQIRSINRNERPGACAETPMNKAGGVGLRRFIKPLRAYVYAEQRPWVYVAAVAGVVGVPLLIGYALGRSK